MQQIRFFKKSRMDLSFSQVVITASQGNDYADKVRNRSLNNGWATTGSVDADNTTFEVDFIDVTTMDTIVLNDMNFASYKIEKWNGLAYEAFSPAIDVTGNTKTTRFHQFTSVEPTKIRLTIRGTITPDEDKFMSEMLVCESIGQFEGWPVVKAPIVSRDRKELKMLSGKVSIRESIGFRAYKLECPNLSSDADLSIVEQLFGTNEGFHVWISGGDESQFSSVRMGFREVDIPLMKPRNELSNEWYKGFYKSGVKMAIDLKEVVD